MGRQRSDDGCEQQRRDVRAHGPAVRLLRIRRDAARPVAGNGVSHWSGAILGYLTTGMFLDRWYCERSGSSTRVVEAVLSLLDPEQEPPTDAHLQVCLPRIRSAGLEYRVAGIQGAAPPSEAGACVVLLNPAQIPVTPG